MKNPESWIIFKLFGRLVRILPRQYRFGAVISLLLLLLNSALDLLGLGALVPLITVVLRENAIAESPYLNNLYQWSGLQSLNGFITALCLGILIIILVKNITSLWIHYYQARFSYRLQRFYSFNLFKAYYNKGFLFFKATSSPKIFRNIQSVPNVFATNILLPLLSVLNELVILAFIVVGLTIYNVQIVLLLVVVILPAFSIFYYSTKNKAKEVAEQQHTLTPKLFKNIMEAVYGYSDVKITNTEKEFYSRHQFLQAQLMGYQTIGQVLKMAPNKIIEVAMFSGIVAIMIYGVYSFDSRTDLLTLLSLFAVSAYRVLPSVNRILVGVMSLNAYKYTVRMIEEEGAYNDVKISLEEELTLNFRSSIEINDVSFSYDRDKPKVFSGLRLSIKKGEVIGLVGSSGSGKTTLMNLLLGFISPNSGEIRIDDIALDAAHLNAWRNAIGYVQQDVYILDATLRENVAFGYSSDEIDDNRVIDSLKKASLGSLLDELDGGIFAEVGEHGGQLSGGQRQRVGIARALYSGASTLFFDEATSALDVETENEVTDAIHELSGSSLTIIIIAHRYTTLKYCDRIVRLERGKVEGEYTYEELLSVTDHDQ